MGLRTPTFAAFALVVAGCGAVLGIDDAHVDPTFHPGASAGGAGSAGTTSQGGSGALAGSAGTTSGSGGQSGGGGALGTGGAGATGGTTAGGNGGMAPGGMAGMGGMAPVGMGGTGPGIGGMGPGMGGMGPGMGGMGPGMGGMGCGTNSTAPVMNGGTVVVVVNDCSGKTGATPQLRIAAHPNNSQMNPPNMAPYLDMNPMLPETAMLTPGDGMYVIDAILDYPPFINPPAPPSGMDAVSAIGNVAVQGPMGANVTLWLH